MKPYKFLLSVLLVAGIASLIFFGCTKMASNTLAPNGLGTKNEASTGKASVYATLTLSAAPGKTYIDITVTAGSTGAASGFTLQWMTQAAYDLWNSTHNANKPEIWPTDSTTFCAGSFSGNANMSRYNLTATAPGNSVTVRVGDLLFDNGASVGCADPTVCPCISPLACNTAYVFRAFAHGDNSLNKSVWSATLLASTTACDVTGNCAPGGGLGYWKNLDKVTGQTGEASWNLPGGLTLGTVAYTDDQLEAILEFQDSGDGLVIVSHQLITALLNQAAGRTYDATGLAAIAAAQAYIGSNVIPLVKSTGKTNPFPAGGVPTINGTSVVDILDADNQDCTVNK